MKKLSLEEIAKEEELHVQRIEQGTQPKERFVKLTFLIATEGTQTEPNYFKALKTELEKSNRFNIEISIEGKGKSTTKNLTEFGSSLTEMNFLILTKPSNKQQNTTSTVHGQTKALNFGYCCISKMFPQIQIAKISAIC